MAIDPSKYTSPEAEEVFDDIMDQLTPSQRNKVLGINVQAFKAVKNDTLVTIKSTATKPRVKMTPLRFLWLPVVFVVSMTGFACLLLSLFLCATLIGLPIGIPMFMGSVIVFWGPWQKWLWGTTGNLWYVKTVTA